VVIIIGILISGISAGIDLYDDYKLRVAQNMTKNSRVGRINNLELWLETTTEYSLATGTTSFIDKLTLNNQDQVGRWNDINPNILPIAHNNATQATLDNQPKYIRKGLNGLPTLSFDGSNDFFSYDGNFLVGSDYTIFVVEARGSGKNLNCFLSGSATLTNTNMVLCYRSSNIITHVHWNYDLDKTIPAFSSEIGTIHSFVFSQNTGKEIYTNGGTKTVNTTQKIALTSYPGSTIAKYQNNYYFGNIAEIIFYSRTLSDQERKDVESYLSKKWSIKLS
jgi:hypothetical protein